jgi:hypothetical protein
VLAWGRPQTDSGTATFIVHGVCNGELLFAVVLSKYGVCYNPPYYPVAGPDPQDISRDFGCMTTPDAADTAAFSLSDHSRSTRPSIPIVFLS